MVFGGRLAWLHEVWDSRLVVPIVCVEMLTELRRVLAYPKLRLQSVRQESLLLDYLGWAEVLALPDPAPALPADCRDRDDVVFIQLAIASSADILVSGDSDLTTLAPAVNVMRPDALRAVLGL